eukprot:SAG31_NODE_4112_length_3572_cov_25.724446_2_plen_349_part_00
MAYGGLPPFEAGRLNYSFHAGQRLYADGRGITAMREDAIAAYTHGLLYAGDGDSRRCALMRRIMDSWTASPPPHANWTTVGLQNGLQVAWGTSLWPRAAEIARYYCPGEWPGAAAFGAWMVERLLPQVDEGASTNGNIGLVMTEAAAGIAVFTENYTLWNTSINRWRAQAPAYVYVRADGPAPRRPPQQRYLAHTGPVCGPSCNDKQMDNYWHGQTVWVRDGLCQETCRDLGHVQLGYATLVNTAETAWQQGLDLYGEEQDRLIAGAELHSSLLMAEPAPFRQPIPIDICKGKVKGNLPPPRGTKPGGTWSMLARHFVMRKGLKMPNTTALVPLMEDHCWDQMCWWVD